MKITEDILRQVKEIPLESVLSGFPKQGKFYICPFQDCQSGSGPNKTSAFRIYDNNYKCFSCQKSGDIIQFYIDCHNYSFPNAVKMICQSYGIIIPGQGDHEIQKYPVCIWVGTKWETCGSKPFLTKLRYYEISSQSYWVEVNDYLPIDRLKGNVKLQADYKHFYNYITQMSGYELVEHEIEYNKLVREDTPWTMKILAYDMAMDIIYQRRIERAKELISKLEKSRDNEIGFNSSHWIDVWTYIMEERRE
jgi:hypothetical protein